MSRMRYVAQGTRWRGAARCSRPQSSLCSIGHLFLRAMRPAGGANHVEDTTAFTGASRGWDRGTLIDPSPPRSLKETVAPAKSPSREAIPSPSSNPSIRWLSTSLEGKISSLFKFEVRFVHQSVHPLDAMSSYRSQRPDCLQVAQGEVEWASFHLNLDLLHAESQEHESTGCRSRGTSHKAGYPTLASRFSTSRSSVRYASAGCAPWPQGDQQRLSLRLVHLPVRGR